MTDAWNGIADEFLHLYPSGRRLLAVAGADAERSRLSADALGGALAAAGHEVERFHSDHVDEQMLRSDVIAPFRDAPKADSVLIVSGPSGLLDAAVRGLWNFTLWQIAGDEPPHSVASALVDVTDPAHPIRRTADYCALPASFGA